MTTSALKILLVDDSDFILQRLQLLLRELEGVKEVKSVTSAEEGTLLLTSYTPDLVFLDINLPGKNGLQMLKDIRKMSEFDPVVVILTNNTLSGYRAECLENGADYFLDKAKDFQTIPAIVEKACHRLSKKEPSDI
ncbi:MAG: hypothetical protein NVS3B15_05990 [Sediminibacterium sp.]